MEQRTKRIPIALLGVATLVAAAAIPSSCAADAQESPGFDTQVAPLLARRCLTCHNASERKGGLDLSRQAAVQEGGDSGRAIEPGKIDESLLWQRVSGDEMPPDAPLPAEEKALLRAWIAAGAKWGTDPIDPFRYSSDQRAGYDWWSLQPVRAPEEPEVRRAEWPRNEIDRFILAKLEAAGLEPAPEADARTLVRRLYFDLIGLPPSPEEMEEWTARLTAEDGRIDDGGYRALVDLLLDSPHHGERWARHWLDVIRFGESQGFERNKIRENAWRYRDWVIRALNRDMPYDEFVRRQIAGDVLYPDDLNALVATGYHVCGTWDQVGYLEGSAEMQKAVRQDGLEDLVATLGQAYLGLSIHCARCHDHKFDPIPQRDYYRIAALLGGVTQAEKEREGITLQPATEEYRQWRETIEGKRRELAELEQSIRGRSGTEGNTIAGLQVLYRPEESDGKVLPDRAEVGEPLNLTTDGGPPFSSSGPATKVIQASKTSGELTIEAWITPGKSSQSGPARIVTLSQDTGQRNFTLGHDGTRFDVRLRTTKTDQNGQPSLSTPDGKTTEKRTHVVFTFDRAGTWRLYVDGQQVASKEVGGDLSNWNDGYRLALGDELSGERRWEGRFHFVAVYSAALSAEQVERNFRSESRDVRAGASFEELLAQAPAEERARHAALREEVARLEQADPSQQFAGVAHVIIPKQPPVMHVLHRGDYRNPRDVVAPAGLQALETAGLPADFGLAPDAPEAERRAKLAAWLTDPRNPLVPRVLVNRLWHYHLGCGIVDTPSDFGFAGGRPSHPELLDWLAARFVADGWRIKDMHRLIVTSATYRQVSNIANEKAAAVDADNRLLWRANVRRLEGEAVRDAALLVSGALNPRIGGPSYRDVKVTGGVMGTNAEFTEPTGEFSDAVNRRTIYRLWARSGGHPLLESLDCPDPSVMTPARTETITPLQALSLLNNNLMEQCAARFADRVRSEAGDDADRQIARAYASALGRAPREREAELARAFVAERGLEQFCLVLLNTNEFLYVE